MGLETRGGGGNNTFLQVIGGKLTKKVDEGAPGAESRENKLGNVVWELKYDILTDCIFQELKFEDSDYGEQMKLHVVSGGELYIISVPVESRYGNSLMWKLPFIDAEKKFNIAPYDFEPEPGKKMVGFSITQGVGSDGKPLKVESGYDPKEQVPPVGVSQDRKGNPVYDYTARQNWLANELEQWANSVDPMSVAETPVAEKPIKDQILAKNAANKASIDDEFEDLPF